VALLRQQSGHLEMPADRSFVMVNGEAKPRVRSMSMNFYLGGFWRLGRHDSLIPPATSFTPNRRNWPIRARRLCLSSST